MSYPNTTFPTTLDNPTNPVAGDFMDVFDHSGLHDFENNAIKSLETKVGADGSAVTTTHDYKLSGITGAYKAVTTQTTTGNNTGDQTISDATISTTDITTNNVSSTKHGFTPKSPADATKFLNGATTPAFASPKDSDLTLTDVTTNNVSASAHGFAPKFPNNTTTFLRGDGTYATPPYPTGVVKVYSDATYHGEASSTPSTAYTQTINANTFAIGQTMHLNVPWSYSGNGGNNTTITITYGGTTIYTDTLGSVGPGIVDLYLSFVTATTANIWNSKNYILGSLTTSPTTIPNITSNQTFTITVVGIGGVTTANYWSSFMEVI